MREAWKDSGKIATAVSFGLLLVAYGFYSDDQPRTLGQALGDLVTAQLASVAPVAVLTQWLLIAVFWVIFGVLVAIPVRQILIPLGTLAGVAVITVQVMLVPVVVWAFRHGNLPLAIGCLVAVPVLHYLNIGLHATLTTPDNVDAKPWHPVDQIAYESYLLSLAGVTVISVFAMLGTGAYYFLKYARAPHLAEVLRVDLVMMSVIFLLTCFMFRSKAVLDEYEIPDRLLHFVDLSLAVAAAVIALSGLPGSAVVVGSTPVWLVAIAPPLAAIVVIVLLNLRENLTSVPRWRIALPATLGLGLLALPLKALLTVVLAPAVALVFH